MSEARIGHPGEFEASLQKLRGKGTDISEEAAEIKDSTEKLQYLPKSKILDLFHKDYICPVTVGVGLMVLQQFGGMNAVYFYASEIFVSAGIAFIQADGRDLQGILDDRTGQADPIKEERLDGVIIKALWMI